MACGISRYQKWSGKSFWVMESPDMKCSLKVLIAPSAEFLQWMWGGTCWNFSFTSLVNVFRTSGHSLSRIRRCGFKNLYWSTGCGVFGALLWDPSLILSWGVQRGLYLSHNDNPQGYTYCPCLKWLGTFLFDMYKFTRRYELSWKIEDWCFLTVWLEETGRALDLVLDAWIFLVWILGLSAVAGGAQVWLIVFLWGVCEPGQW